MEKEERKNKCVKQTEEERMNYSRVHCDINTLTYNIFLIK